MKDFYRSNTFLAIVSVIIAIVIWIYVVYEVNPMYETWVTDIPVKCTNISSLFDDGSLVITGDNENLIKGGSTISLRVKGKRSVVSSLEKKNFSCSLDMLTVTEDGTYTLKPNIDSDISGIEIVKSEPYKFEITAQNIEQRDIKVKVKTQGTLPEGFTIDDVKVHNETVKITGASSVIDKVNKAEIVFDYDALDVKDSEKTYKISFLDKEGNEIDSSRFKKTVEYAKLTFNLYTTKEVTVLLMPKYADEINKNHYGKSVKLALSGNGTQKKDGGLEMKVKLKGTASALEKYTDSQRIVYTEDIDVSGIYSNRTFDNIKAAELSNSVWYVDVPSVKVKASVEEK